MSKYNILREDENQSEKKEPANIEQSQNSKVPEEEPLFDSPSESPVIEEKQTPGDDYFADELFPVAPESESENGYEKKADELEVSESPTNIDDQDFVSEPSAEEQAPTAYNETAESEYPITEKKP